METFLKLVTSRGGINRTFSELKRSTSCAKEVIRCGINRTFLELKYQNEDETEESNKCINRTFLELKFLRAGCAILRPSY